MRTAIRSIQTYDKYFCETKITCTIFTIEINIYVLTLLVLQGYERDERSQECVSAGEPEEEESGYRQDPYSQDRQDPYSQDPYGPYHQERQDPYGQN